VQVVEQRLALLLADRAPLSGGLAGDCAFDSIEGTDPFERLVGDRGVAALGDLVEAAANVGPACDRLSSGKGDDM
jgi:hypothetical protein